MNAIYNFLKRGAEEVGNCYNTEDLIKWLMKESKRKRKLYPRWVKKIRSSHTALLKHYSEDIKRSRGPSEEHLREKNDVLGYYFGDRNGVSDEEKRSAEEYLKRIADENGENVPSFIFYEKKLGEVFEYFLTELFPFKRTHLKKLGDYERYYKGIVVDYRYEFTESELEGFLKFKHIYSIDEPVEKIIEILFDALVSTMGRLLGEIFPNDNVKVEMLCGAFKRTKISVEPEESGSSEDISDSVSAAEEYSDLGDDTVSDNSADADTDVPGSVIFRESGDSESDLDKRDGITSENTIATDSSEYLLRFFDKAEYPHIDFTVCVRVRENILFNHYYMLALYGFSEKFTEIPPEIKSELKKDAEKTYLLALSRYPDIKKYITAVVKRKLKKCTVLEHITPILDFMNFVLSRFEDSVYKLDEVLEEFYRSSEFPLELKDTYITFFHLVNRYAGMFSTFQSNNRSKIRDQFNMFVFSLHYFLTQDPQDDISRSDLFYPEYFAERWKSVEHSGITRYYIRLLKTFLNFGIMIQQNQDIIFEEIFGHNLRRTNELFIKSFAYSLNCLLHDLIEDKNKNMPVYTKISFEELVNFLLSALEYIIDKIFLADTPEKASRNFRDKLGRYNPKQIAMRTIEMLLFEELPLSDNIWENYIMSLCKDKVRARFRDIIKIPDDYFFDKKSIMHLIMIYQFSLEPKILLEDWIIDYGLLPFCKFIDGILKDIRSALIEKAGNEITNIGEIVAELDDGVLGKIISNIIYRRISRGIIDEVIKESMESIGSGIATFFLPIIREMLEKNVIPSPSGE